MSPAAKHAEPPIGAKRSAGPHRGGDSDTGSDSDGPVSPPCSRSLVAISRWTAASSLAALARSRACPASARVTRSRSRSSAVPSRSSASRSRSLARSSRRLAIRRAPPRAGRAHRRSTPAWGPNALAPRAPGHVHRAVWCAPPLAPRTAPRAAPGQLRAWRNAARTRRTFA